MLTFTDGFKLMQDDVDKAVKAAVKAITESLPQEANRMDVVKTILKESVNVIDRLPVLFQNI